MGERVTAWPPAIHTAGPHWRSACFRVRWLGSTSFLCQGDRWLYLWQRNSRWQRLTNGAKTWVCFLNKLCTYAGQAKLLVYFFQGILQALEYLLLKGYAPRRGFYIGLGHDEEVCKQFHCDIANFNGIKNITCKWALENFFVKVRGHNGAMNIVRVLKQQGVQLSFVLDEGLAISDGIIPGLEGPAALWEPACIYFMLFTCAAYILYMCGHFMICRIGLSEKGQALLKLSVSMAPGHSSMPPRESSIGILAAAVKRWEHCFFIYLFIFLSWLLVNFSIHMFGCFLNLYCPTSKKSVSKIYLCHHVSSDWRTTQCRGSLVMALKVTPLSTWPIR